MALLAAFNFDEASGNVLDVTGNGHDWTLNTGAQRTASGHTLGGLTKLGAGFATVAATPFGQTTARTFMFWSQGAGNGVWWLRWYATSPDTGTWGIYNLGGTVNLRLRKGGSNTNITVAFPGDGLFHHYAGTYDGTVSKLYLDGTLVATSGTVTAPLDTADSIQVLETSLTTQTLDDLRIYDEALTQPQIAALMATPVVANTGVAVRGNATTGLATTATAVKVAKVSGICSLGAASVASASKRAPCGGRLVAGLSATASGRKRAITTGAATAGVVTSGRAAKRAPSAGVASLGLAATRSGPVARIVAGICALGTVLSGRSTKRAPQAGAAPVGAAATGTGQRRAPAEGRAAFALAGTAAAGKRVPLTGRAHLALAADGRILPAVSRGSMDPTARAAAVMAPTDRDTAEMRPE